MPDTSDNRLVCIAAISRLQCNINALFGIPNIKKAAGNRRPLQLSLYGEAAYSAACFRGGSSAPESWISATW
jgi:hypothetical protein